MIPSGSSSLGSFTGFKAHEFVAHAGKTNCVVVGPRSGQVLATGGDDKRVNVWRIGRASSIWSLTGNSSAIESLRFDPTEEFLVSGSAGGAVKLFDLSAGKMTRHFRGHMSNVTVIDCGSFDRRFITTGSMDCQVKLWNVETKECAMAFKGHNAEVTDVQFSPDGYILASAAADGQVKLWDLKAGKPMHTFQACSGGVHAIRFNPQELLLAVATSDRTVKLYDIEFMELFCVTSADTCTTRAITFEPDGQHVYCASPSGLRRWSWDNDTASVRLEAMGDVAWGKVGAGALHYNADGRQLLAASCAGSRVSVWAVNVDVENPLLSGSQPQRQELTGSASPPAPASGSPAPTSPPATRGETRTPTESPSYAPPPTMPREYEDTDAKSLSARSSRRSTSRERTGRDERPLSRDSKHMGEDKYRGDGSNAGGNGVTPSFQIRGRQLPLPLLSAAAEEKVASSPPNALAFVAATLAPNPCGIAGGSTSASAVASGVLQNRLAARAEAVAATIAAVASAKAATDDAVASVSSSCRHRSIGTSISDTLVIAAHLGGGGSGLGGVRGVVNRDDDGAGSGREYRSEAAASPGPAPGKEDGSNGGDRGRGVGAPQGVVTAGDRHRLGGERRTTGKIIDNEQTWHKRVAGGAGGVDDAADDGKGGEHGVVSRGGDRSADEKEVRRKGGGTDSEAAGESVTYMGVRPRFTVNHWSHDSRRGTGEAGEGARAGVREGEDSPPLMGSPKTAPGAAATTEASFPTRSRNAPPFLPSSYQRSPESSRQRNIADAIVPQSSSAGFPVTIADNYHSSTGADDPGGLPPGENKSEKEGGGGSIATSGSASEGMSIADEFADGVGKGNEELGMTRPRTATRRWDRPGPPSDDEVIAQTLLSRATVTSTLSNRLTHLRMLRYGWANGDVSATISRLKRLERSAIATDESPRAVVADFLWVVPLDGVQVTLEHCLEMMPLLEGLWKLDAGSCVAAATRCLESIVRRFGGFVRDTLEAPVASGRVDLAREDRIARCREAHRAFIRGYHHLERSEGEFYEDRRIAAVAERLRPLFESYFMS